MAPNKIPPTLSGRITDEHDEHVMVMNSQTAAIILAGLKCLLRWEGHLLGDAETLAVEELAAKINDGLKSGIESRRKLDDA